LDAGSGCTGQLSMRDEQIESEDVLRAVVRSMAEGVIVWTADGNFSSCNDAAERLLGISRASIEGRTFGELGWQLIHEDGTPFVERPIYVSLRDGRAQYGVVMGLKKPDGSLTWVSFSTVPLRKPSETKPYAVVSTFADVTELRQSKAHFLEAMNGANVGTWELDHATGRVERNERWAATLGYSLSDIEPSIEGFASRIHPSDRSQWESALQAAREHLTPWVLECRVKHRNGEWVWVQTRGKVVERAPDGSVRRTAGVLVDIDGRKRMEESLRVSLAENLRLVAELKAALESVKQLESFLPICMYCKSIRDDGGYWAKLEAYIATRTGSVFSHGVCPSCFTERFGDEE
jgi:PAS domain S-box-containing protein